MTEHTLSCAVARDLLPLYADDLASEESRALVQAHLQVCEDCQAQLAAMQTEPEASPNAVQSLRRAKKRLRGIKVAVAVITSLVMLAGIAGGLHLWRFDILAGLIPIDIEQNYFFIDSPTLWVSAPFARIYSESVELSRTRVDNNYMIEEVHFFTLTGTPIDWLWSRTNSIRQFNSTAFQLEHSMEWYPHWAPGEEPPWNTMHFTTIRIYFVSNWAAFSALEDPLTAEAEGLARLLWARE